MAKLTQTQTRKLETVRDNLLRAVKYMKNPEVVGIAKAIDPNKALGNSYLVKNPAACEVCTDTPPAISVSNKYSGSDIAGLYNALALINEFLDNPECKIIVTEEAL